MSPVSELIADAWRYFNAGDYAHAAELAQHGLAQDPDYGPLWQLRGLLQQAQGDTAGAVRCLEAATTLGPLSATAQCALANCYAAVGQSALAGTIFKYLATSKSCPAELLSTVSIGLQRLGDFDGALVACREAARRMPEEDAPWFGIAFCLSRLGYPPDMILSPLQKAFDLAPECMSYRVGLACMLHRAGQLDRACRLIQHLSIETIEAITCTNCLHRLVVLYEAIDDAARRDACSQRLTRLTSQVLDQRSPQPPP
ncbi:MAG: tetratricopeptide repeat protein [Pirellulales bacterium]